MKREREVITVDGMKVYIKRQWVPYHIDGEKYIRAYSKDEEWFNKVLINTSYIVSMRPLDDVED